MPGTLHEPVSPQGEHLLIQKNDAAWRLDAASHTTPTATPPPGYDVCVSAGRRREKAASLASVPALYRQKAPGGASRHQDKRVWASPSVASIPNQTHSYGACGMCVRRFGYRSVTRNSTALLKEWSGCLMQYGSSNPSMPSISVLPRISTVFGVNLFTAVR